MSKSQGYKKYKVRKMETLKLKPRKAEEEKPPAPETPMPHGNSTAMAKECIYCIAKRVHM
jgi:hypothetical protein